MHNFKELKVWQLSRNLVKDVYEISANFLQLKNMVWFLNYEDV